MGGTHCPLDVSCIYVLCVLEAETVDEEEGNGQLWSLWTTDIKHLH